MANADRSSDPSETKALGIALIGCGGMAANYRANYAALPGTIYLLVVDVNADLARSVAEECGVERFSTDWRDALAPNIAIADISTPNHLHTEQAVALLEKGKHVLLQKPMAPTVAECQIIVEAARKADRQAGVYMSDIEDPVAWDLRDMVRGGYLGRVTGVRGRYAHRGGLRAKADAANWRGSAEKTGGGSFIQLSIHHTNLLSWIMDAGIESVMGYAQNLMCPQIGGDDMAACVCAFENGVFGLFDSAWNADGSGLELYGSEGSARMHGGQGAGLSVQTNRPFAGRIIHTEDTKPTVIAPSGTSREQCRADNPLNQHIAFVQAIQSGHPVPVSAEVGCHDVAVVKAVYASAREGRRVFVQEILEGTIV